MTGDAANLPFEDSAFDAVYAGEIIEHLPDPRAGLTEWLRVLKPGGVFIMSTPNLHRLMNVINRAEDVVNPEHISEMSYRGLEAMLRDAGLTVLHEEGIYWNGSSTIFAPARRWTCSHSTATGRSSGRW